MLKPYQPSPALPCPLSAASNNGLLLIATSLPDHAPHHLHLTPGTEAHDDYMRPIIPRLRALAADLAQHETHHAPTPSFFAGMRSIYVSWRVSSISQSRKRRTAGFCAASDVVTA